MQNEEMIQDQETVEGAEAPENENENGTAQAPVDEWTAAALAHASVLITLILGMAGGIGAFIGPAVALAMYFGYREKSRFVAFHALQSCVYQIVGIVLYCIFGAVMGVLVSLAWTVSGILSAVLIGLLLMPFALLMTLFMVLVLVFAPLIWIGYGLYASYQVYQGSNFYYWGIGDWMEREVKI
ncbi:MAG: DUF4870 domain-containing protein [Chloroflexi bacterium]|nr:DUF4870 domain-containing protein [Chloroflexota bacterium]